MLVFPVVCDSFKVTISARSLPSWWVCQQVSTGKCLTADRCSKPPWGATLTQLYELSIIPGKGIENGCDKTKNMIHSRATLWVWGNVITFSSWKIMLMKKHIFMGDSDALKDSVHVAVASLSLWCGSLCHLFMYCPWVLAWLQGLWASMWILAVIPCLSVPLCGFIHSFIHPGAQPYPLITLNQYHMTSVVVARS